MRRFRLKISSDPIEFEADHPSEFLRVWRDMFVAPPRDRDEWRRVAAMLACDWSGKPIRYHSDDAIVWDMMEHGMLEDTGSPWLEGVDEKE